MYSTGRVYLRFGKDYSSIYAPFNHFDRILKGVALSVSRTGGLSLARTEQKTTVVCEAKTKKYIADKATQMICTFRRHRQGDHMALFVSKKQINRMIQLCAKNDRRLTCYAFVILHIIYTHTDPAERELLAPEYDSLRRLIYDLANAYLADHPNDALAQYVVDCHLPLYNTMAGESLQGPDTFPAIYRWFG